MAPETESKLTNQHIALIAICFACAMTFGAFTMSRSNAQLNLMSLTAVLSLGSGLMGIAGTLLVGLQNWRAISVDTSKGGATITETRTDSSSSTKIQPTDPKVETPDPKAV